VVYKSRGRYEVSVEKQGRYGEAYYFPSEESRVFAVIPQKNRTVMITAIRPNAEDIQQLKSIGAKISGNLEVSVAKGLKVLKQNAQSQPGILDHSFRWRIESPSADPVIVIQP